MRTKEEWEREVEALWIEAAHAFFLIGLIVTCVDPELGNPDSPNRYLEDLEKIDPRKLRGIFYAGLDIGKQVDHSALAVVQKINGKRKLIYKHQFPLGTSYPDVIGHVARANQIFDFGSIYVDKTGVGDVIIDEMNEIGIPNAEGLFLTDRSKEEIFTYLKLLMEQKKLGILSDDTELIAQINEQHYEYLQPKTARERIHLKFWHPPRRHDDQLFALALACYASKEEEPTLLVAYPR